MKKLNYYMLANVICVNLVNLLNCSKKNKQFIMCIFSVNITIDLRIFDNLDFILIKPKKMREQDLKKNNHFFFLYTIFFTWMCLFNFSLTFSLFENITI